MLNLVPPLPLCNKAISSDRKIATNCDSGIQPTHLGWRHSNWELLAKELQLAFENQLFEYILYCTEIDINLLLKTYSFHRKFRFIFSLILSENAPNVHFREAKFQNFPGNSPRPPPPPPPSVLAPSALVPIFAGPTMGNSQYNITYLNQTKTFSFFSLEKSAPSVLYIDIYILRAADIRSAQARSAPPPLPPPKKLRTRLPCAEQGYGFNCGLSQFVNVQILRVRQKYENYEKSV